MYAINLPHLNKNVHGLKSKYRQEQKRQSLGNSNNQSAKMMRIWISTHQSINIIQYWYCCHLNVWVQHIQCFNRMPFVHTDQQQTASYSTASTYLHSITTWQHFTISCDVINTKRISWSCRYNWDPKLCTKDGLEMLWLAESHTKL